MSFSGMLLLIFQLISIKKSLKNQMPRKILLNVWTKSLYFLMMFWTEIFEQDRSPCLNPSWAKVPYLAGISGQAFKRFSTTNKAYLKRQVLHLYLLQIRILFMQSYDFFEAPQIFQYLVFPRLFAINVWRISEHGVWAWFNHCSIIVFLTLKAKSLVITSDTESPVWR